MSNARNLLEQSTRVQRFVFYVAEPVRKSTAGKVFKLYYLMTDSWGQTHYKPSFKRETISDTSRIMYAYGQKKVLQSSTLESASECVLFQLSLFYESLLIESEELATRN